MIATPSCFRSPWWLSCSASVTHPSTSSLNEIDYIDEVGYVPLTEAGAEMLFQVISERAEKAAVILG